MMIIGYSKMYSPLVGYLLRSVPTVLLFLALCGITVCAAADDGALPRGEPGAAVRAPAAAGETSVNMEGEKDIAGDSFLSKTAPQFQQLVKTMLKQNTFDAHRFIAENLEKSQQKNEELEQRYKQLLLELGQEKAKVVERGETIKILTHQNYDLNTQHNEMGRNLINIQRENANIQRENEVCKQQNVELKQTQKENEETICSNRRSNTYTASTLLGLSVFSTIFYGCSYGQESALDAMGSFEVESLGPMITSLACSVVLFVLIMWHFKYYDCCARFGIAVSAMAGFGSAGLGTFATVSLATATDTTEACVFGSEEGAIAISVFAFISAFFFLLFFALAADKRSCWKSNSCCCAWDKPLQLQR